MSNLNIPNVITGMRLALVPLMGNLLLAGRYSAGIAVFLVAGISDFFDGYLARRLHQTTRIGAILDPLADKVLVVLSILILGGQHAISWWLVSVILGREAIIAVGVTISFLRHGQPGIQPTFISKLNTCLQLTLIFVVLVRQSGVHTADTALQPLILLTMTSTTASGVHYLFLWTRAEFSSRNDINFL